MRLLGFPRRHSILCPAVFPGCCFFFFFLWRVSTKDAYVFPGVGCDLLPFSWPSLLYSPLVLIHTFPYRSFALRDGITPPHKTVPWGRILMGFNSLSPQLQDFPAFRRSVTFRFSCIRDFFEGIQAWSSLWPSFPSSLILPSGTANQCLVFLHWIFLLFSALPWRSTPLSTADSQRFAEATGHLGRKRSYGPAINSGVISCFEAPPERMLTPRAFTRATQSV